MMKARMFMQKKLGMVIVNYNDYLLTSRLLKNVKDYKCLNHIVVVDNNSSLLIVPLLFLSKLRKASNSLSFLK